MRMHLLWPAFLVVFMLLSGCQTARMPVPEALTASEPMAVAGRQGSKIKEHLQFGPYRADAIDRSWTKGRDLQVGAYEGNRRRQQYTFILREGQSDVWRVSCEAFLRRRSIHTEVVDVELTNRSSLDCSLHAAGDPAAVWHLALAEKGERPLEGQLSGEGGRLAVQGTR